MAKPADKSTMRALGEFFGHIIKGAKSSPDQRPPASAVRTSVEEEERQTPAGKVVLRRTIIEEVVMPAPTNKDASER